MLSAHEMIYFFITGSICRITALTRICLQVCSKHFFTFIIREKVESTKRAKPRLDGNRASEVFAWRRFEKKSEHIVRSRTETQL